ncbi:HAD-superfamily subfamily IIA hydrolase, TIGR01459 [Oceaniovalibus guishaninsula JLT2003]|uniref:HAD-superfamily subfamily IIA hydrolase, TIGR01459 n=1 Tax=Oceaniovalibus guishaninsula JLT2003 TaxID=1231392 RepID=K2HMV8_9RHOB|nr:TIGR01459 family HAD-type hydrolase [Oceaniovalibus guishaninsula]EKE44149.1 HAD-superfamily subfamily IIA hydrolase, TIGR01459 [Oceaniovalibus guishaninsula JLT2003]
MTQIIHHLSEIASSYDALFCDLWGCLHNGVTAFPEAVAALRDFRQSGGVVVLLTNAPRPRASVAEQIAGMGVPEDCWDTIATSGDSARAAMFMGAVGSDIFFIGEDRDTGFFEPMAIVPDPVPIRRVPLEQAEGIVCTGPFDALADPEVLRPQLLYAKTKGLTMLNANPDIVVDRGDVREWCGGAVAALYERMGGKTMSFGKPHPPVYDLARRRLAELGRDVSDDRILAVGDGIATDIQGAQGEGLDSLFVTGGLAALETATDVHPGEEDLRRFLSANPVSPTFAIGKLR